MNVVYSVATDCSAHAIQYARLKRKDLGRWWYAEIKLHALMGFKFVICERNLSRVMFLAYVPDLSFGLCIDGTQQSQSYTPNAMVELLQFYTTFVRPTMEYAAPVWHAPYERYKMGPRLRTVETAATEAWPI